MNGHYSKSFLTVALHSAGRDERSKRAIAAAWFAEPASGSIGTIRLFVGRNVEWAIAISGGAANAEQLFRQRPGKICAGRSADFAAGGDRSRLEAESGSVAIEPGRADGTRHALADN